MTSIVAGLLAGVLAGLAVVAFGASAALWLALATAVLVIAAGAVDYVRTRQTGHIR